MNLKGMAFQQGNCAVVSVEELPPLRLVVANRRENTHHLLTVTAASGQVVPIRVPEMVCEKLESYGNLLTLAIDVENRLALRFDSEPKQALPGSMPAGAALVVGQDVCLSAQDREGVPRVFRLSDGQEVDARSASIYYVERWTLLLPGDSEHTTLFSHPAGSTTVTPLRI